MSEVVSYQVVDRVAHITIERPDKRNAMDLEVFAQLAERTGQITEDDEVGAAVVAGRGGTFSAGLDLALFGSQLTEGVEPGFITRLQAAFTAFEELDVPVIAAIEGHCLGGGIQLALACHLRAVAPSARLGVLETSWGLIPDLGGSWRLPQLVGLGRATELVLSAREVTASEARAMGLAELDLPDQGAQEAAHDLAARLANGPAAVRRAPRLLRENLGRDRRSALAAEAATQLELMAGADFAEAVGARVEGREPRFEGR
ncbi:MAG: enoyl-CoA hydratase/isomerase family protein [Nitriliruptoraceae bacterium]